ncbi:hypothetical protein CO046_00675 [Candidatus Peregrinibacteria bacterium CG_4_9_14_0_2_um_filter_53_11]|nr:MAG: hypothetical protein CO046_00675 [Candidatus Peregrinibacteria bacterium CG_4_9_14_0_2_um_filter_53_11]
MDNNCDRRIDEGFNVGEVCNEPGVCGDGVIVCKTERATECSSLVRRGGLNPNDPESNDVDLCNDNLDNDCDGQVNDGCACNPGDTLPCGSDVGACAEGLRACVDGSYEDACNGGAEPAAETCDVTDLNPDGTDSDCNGQTDVVQFRLGQACEGACGEGERECDGQGGVRCSTDIDGSEFNPTSDLCDGADNDCDGIVDEGEGENAGYPLTRDLPGQNDLFATGEILAVPGECRFGTATCDDSTEGRSLRIVPHTQPVEERPNGLDDDCDGQPDEGFDCLPGDTQNCGALPERGICQQGEQTCTDAGEWGSCEGLIEPAVENPCNGLDDDCDGEADELAGVGAPRNAVGACADRAGVAAGVAEKVCENGVARLVPSNGPEGTNDQSTEELCNGQDDDCDGMTDENFTLSTGARVGEPTGLPGVCADGVVECATVRSVRPSVQPSVEQCNGADDDCDGTVDDGFRVGESCSNACGDVGVYTCNGVNSSRCSVQTPAEVAGNGVDDDCDGQTDE